VPDTDDADLYLVPVAQCLRRLCEQRTGPKAPTLSERMQRWAQRCAPDVAASVIADAVATAMRTGVIENPDKIAVRLHVSYEERQRLKLVTIGSFDVNKAGRTRLRKERQRLRDRIRAAAERAARGAVPRAQYLLAHSLSRTRPWEAEGISRSTWERRRKTAFTGGQRTPSDASPSPSTLIYKCGDGLASRQNVSRMPATAVTDEYTN
jgi:hypothetical protein